MKSLVIEPDPKRKQLLKSSLADLDASIVTRLNALSILKKIKETKPDLIVVDARVPNVDLQELAKIVQELYKLSAKVQVLMGQLPQTPSEIVDSVKDLICKVPDKRSTDSDIYSLYKQLGLSQDQLAQILQVPSRTLARWLAGESKPSISNQDKIEKVKLFYRKISRLLTPEGIKSYLFGYNENLHGKRPFDLLVAQDFDSVLADLGALEEGVYA